MQLSSLSSTEQRIYDIVIEEAEELYGPGLRADTRSGTRETAMLFSRVLNRVLEEDGDYIERRAAQKVRELESNDDEFDSDMAREVRE